MALTYQQINDLKGNEHHTAINLLAAREFGKLLMMTTEEQQAFFDGTDYLSTVQQVHNMIFTQRGKLSLDEGPVHFLQLIGMCKQNGLLFLEPDNFGGVQ